MIGDTQSGLYGCSRAAAVWPGVSLLVLLVLPLAACGGGLPTGSESRESATPSHLDIYVHAHEDDWQLFMGDRTYASAQSAEKLVLVYTTAGDAGLDTAYWLARERGALAATDSVLAAGSWACAAHAIGTHPIQRCVKGGAVSYFMRMPDGNSETGNGYGHGSLSVLRDQGAATTALDNSTTYSSWPDFTATLRSIIDEESGGHGARQVSVHSPDWDRSVNPGDHPDHLASADAVRAGSLERRWVLNWYIDYATRTLPTNLTQRQRAIKERAFLGYDAVMVDAGNPSLAQAPDYLAWLGRTYVRTIRPASDSTVAPYDRLPRSIPRGIKDLHPPN